MTTMVEQFFPVFKALTAIESELTAESSLLPDLLQDQFLGLLVGPVEFLLSGEYTLKNIQDAQFALAALVDEIILGSAYSHALKWQQEPIQKQLFGTTTAGNEFFSRLDNLNELDPEQQEVREVFLFCLKQGFSGCYFDVGQRATLDSIIQANYKLLKQTVDLPKPTFDAGDTTNFVVKLARKSHGISLVSIWAPILFVIALYLFLRSEIASQIELLFQSI